MTDRAHPGSLPWSDCHAGRGHHGRQGSWPEKGAALRDATGSAHRLPLILIADDDDDFREYICTILAGSDYELLPVSDGAAAMDYIDTALLDPLAAHLPDLLITDIQMPCCSGLKVLAYAKFLPTIAMTAFGDASTHEEARRCGANFVFDKPIDVRMLRRVVGALVH